MSICVISQPRFFPSLHYLHRMMVTDTFVVLDTVQFDPHHEENRAKIKTPKGSEWLTIPMHHASHGQLVQHTRIDQRQAWQHRSVGTLHAHYRKAPFYTAYAPEIVGILEKPHDTLSQLDQASWEPALRLLGITCRFVNASDLSVSGKGTRLLLDICKCVGATTYLSGGFGRDYLKLEEFSAAGVKVAFHDYIYPVYSQLHGAFVPFLSYLDLLFNAGLSRDSVMAGGRMVHDAIPTARLGAVRDTA